MDQMCGPFGPVDPDVLGRAMEAGDRLARRTEVVGPLGDSAGLVMPRRDVVPVSASEAEPVPVPGPVPEAASVPAPVVAPEPEPDAESVAERGPESERGPVAGAGVRLSGPVWRVARPLSDGQWGLLRTLAQLGPLTDAMVVDVHAALGLRGRSRDGVRHLVQNLERNGLVDKRSDPRWSGVARFVTPAGLEAVGGGVDAGGWSRERFVAHLWLLDLAVQVLPRCTSVVPQWLIGASEDQSVAVVGGGGLRIRVGAQLEVPGQGVQRWDPDLWAGEPGRMSGVAVFVERDEWWRAPSLLLVPRLRVLQRQEWAVSRVVLVVADPGRLERLDALLAVGRDVGTLIEVVHVASRLPAA